MRIQARYYANLKDGKTKYLCSSHLSMVAVRLDGVGHLRLKRGVMRVGTLSQFTSKLCEECLRADSATPPVCPAPPDKDTIQQSMSVPVSAGPSEASP